MYKTKIGEVSLLALRATPQLLQDLDTSDFYLAWRNAVELHGDILDLCNECEREYVRRILERETDK